MTGMALLHGSSGHAGSFFKTRIPKYSVTQFPVAHVRSSSTKHFARFF